VQVIRTAKVKHLGLTFSHDGDYLYSVRAEGDNLTYYFLYKIPVLGGTEKRLISDLGSKATFSADEEQLAFERYLAGDKSELLFTEEFEVVIMIDVVTEEMHGSDRDSDPN
jgi:hypothetical protein